MLAPLFSPPLVRDRLGLRASTATTRGFGPMRSPSTVEDESAGASCKMTPERYVQAVSSDALPVANHGRTGGSRGVIRKSAVSDRRRRPRSNRPSRLVAASAFLALLAAAVYILAASHAASHFADSSGTSASRPCAVCAPGEPPTCVTMTVIAVDPPISTSHAGSTRLQAFPSGRVEGTSLPRAPPSPEMAGSAAHIS